MTQLTQELARSLFDYRDGDLFWKVNRGYNKVKGNRAGSLNKNSGYYYIRINTKPYPIHKLIFLYHHGYLPKEIDHIDRNKSNNLIENLRDVTHSQNNMNKVKQLKYNNKKCTSQYKGVTYRKQNKKWRARITINKKEIFLGYFKSEIEAAKAYNTKAIELFGEYVYLNNV